MHSTFSSTYLQPLQGPHLRVTLFGEPSVTFIGEKLECVPMATRCILLLAYLILNPNNRSRLRISATLWPDSPDSVALAKLRRSLHEVVRALPRATTPWILIDTKRIAWNSLAPIWCDVELFDRLGSDEATLSSAVELYRDEVLAGDDNEWVVGLRSRLRERQIEALLTLAERHRHRGDVQGATLYYRRLLTLDPFREDALRSLLRLLYTRGDRAQAAFVYREFVTQLRADLDVDPMPETVAEYEQMARGLIYQPRHQEIRSLRIVGNE